MTNKNLSGKAANIRPLQFWWKLSVPLPVSESLQQILWESGSTGMHEADGFLHAFFESDNPQIGFLRQTFESNPYLGKRFMLVQVPAEDWESGWKKHFKPIRITKRFVVRPSWEPYKKKKGESVIVIDPKMSFGTGTHETTQIMLQLMETVNFKGRAVLDAGTGTGILAIAAVLLKARIVYAADVEAESVENTRENIRTNKTGSKIRVAQVSFAELPLSWISRYDVILANIQRSVLEPNLGKLTGMIRKNAWVILSGILHEEDGMFRKALRNAGWRVLKKKKKKEWMGYIVRQDHDLE